MAINLFGGNYFFGDWSATISSDGEVIYSPQTSASFLCNTTSDPAGDLVSCVQRLGWCHTSFRISFAIATHLLYDKLFESTTLLLLLSASTLHHIIWFNLEFAKFDLVLLEMARPLKLPHSHPAGKDNRSDRERQSVRPVLWDLLIRLTKVILNQILDALLYKKSQKYPNVFLQHKKSRFPETWETMVFHKFPWSK